MNKPCEYCGCDLPLGVDKKTRQQRSKHFATCKARPVPEVEPFAQRTWVGLTTEDMATCINEPAWDLVLRKAEQILKEKNT